MKNTPIIRIFFWITLFSISMAFLETSVVVYLRKLYYPEGFDFPFKIIDKDIMVVEIFRELATLIMLLGAGFLSGRSRTEKFGLFLFSFAVWDIFYYIFLKITLNWPSSLMTWDILFLIPTTWVGPVIAPLLISVIMIVFAIIISRSTSRSVQIRIKPLEWMFLISGSFVLIIGFIYDYVRFMLQFFSLSELFLPSNSSKLMQKALLYIPVSFPWLIFLVGLITIMVGITLFYLRTNSEKSIRI
jgi:hypothetical protein